MNGQTNIKVASIANFTKICQKCTKKSVLNQINLYTKTKNNIDLHNNRSIYNFYYNFFFTYNQPDNRYDCGA